jgi:hypothetical protein
MEFKPVLFNKKRELGVIISDSFEFLQNEFKPLMRLIGKYVLPFIALYALVQIYFQRKIFAVVDFSNPEAFMTNASHVYLNLFMLLLLSILVQSLLAGTFYSYLELYIKNGRGNFTFADVAARLFGNGLMALGANFAYVLVSSFGLLMCFLPGLYLLNTLSLAVFIVVFRKNSIGESFTLSFKLVHTQWWNTLVLNVLGLVLVYAAGMLISLPSIMAGFTVNVSSSAGNAAADAPLWHWILVGLQAVLTTTLLIIPYTFQAMQYFNLVNRAESNRTQQN